MTDTPVPTSRAKGGAAAPPDPWDPLVRITHWTVVAGVLANALITKPGGITHVWIGWTILGLLLLRFAWGLLGPAEARFSAFPPDPRGALSHLAGLMRGTPREHGTHNPAGALMAYALWACLAVVTATGLFMTGGQSPVAIAAQKTAVASGDWSVLVSGAQTRKDEGLKDAAEEVHEVAANLILLLAALHVAGVAAESRALGRNLVRPMLMGPRRR